MSQISNGKLLDAAEPFYDSDTGKLLEVRADWTTEASCGDQIGLHGLAQRATTSQISQQRSPHWRPHLFRVTTTDSSRAQICTGGTGG
jgi:hypothetical protein